MTEDYADYLPEGVARGTPREYIPPEPGTGIVYVGPPGSDGVWMVSWQGPDSRFSSTWGSEEAVVAWALAQPAMKRLICRHADTAGLGLGRTCRLSHPGGERSPGRSATVACEGPTASLASVR